MQNKGSRREVMTYHIEFSEEAEIDANTAGFYYDSKVPGLSFRFFDDLRNALLSLKTNPFTFHIYHNFHPIRRCNLEIFPYAIYFTVETDKIILLSIIHQRRSKAYIKRRLK